MSNQVYSGPQEKYVPMHGINGYILTDDIEVPAAVADRTPIVRTLLFDEPSLIQRDGVFDVSIPGNISMFRGGVCSLNYHIGFQIDGPVVEGQVCDVAAQLIINNGTGAILSEESILARAVANDVIGSHVFKMQLRYVGYLEPGLTVTAQLLNYGADSVITALKNESGLIATQII